MSEIEPTAPLSAADLASEFHTFKKAVENDHLPSKAHPAQIENYTKTEVKSARIPALTVDQVMSSPLVSLSVDSDLKTAANLMESRRFRHLPIMNKDGAMEGIVSDRDLLRTDQPETASLTTIMSRAVRTVLVGTSIRGAARILLNERIGALIVLDLDNIPVGILTNADILRAIVEKAPIELWV